MSPYRYAHNVALLLEGSLTGEDLDRARQVRWAFERALEELAECANAAYGFPDFMVDGLECELADGALSAVVAALGESDGIA